MTTSAFPTRIVTDETLLENKKHGSREFPFQYYHENICDYDFHCIDWHWHQEFEYLFVQSGKAVCFAGKEKITIPSGYGIFINSRVIHRYEADDITMISVTVYSPFLLGEESGLIHQKYILPFLHSGPDCILFDPGIPWQKTCIQQMQSVFDIREKTDTDDIRMMALLFDFWSEIHHHWGQSNEQTDKETSRMNQARLQIMMQFIQEHFRENICLEDIASSVHIGKSTAIETFHQGIHQSPIAYLIHYRLKQAGALLAFTEKKIVTIAEETGFESSTYFCRQFKNLYGMTPNEYRKSKDTRFSYSREV